MGIFHSSHKTAMEKDVPDDAVDLEESLFGSDTSSDSDDDDLVPKKFNQIQTMQQKATEVAVEKDEIIQKERKKKEKPMTQSMIAIETDSKRLVTRADVFIEDKKKRKSIDDDSDKQPPRKRIRGVINLALKDKAKYNEAVAHAKNHFLPPQDSHPPLVTEVFTWFGRFCSFKGNIETRKRDFSNLMDQLHTHGQLGMDAVQEGFPSIRYSEVSSGGGGTGTGRSNKKTYNKAQAYENNAEHMQQMLVRAGLIKSGKNGINHKVYIFDGLLMNRDLLRLEDRYVTTEQDEEGLLSRYVTPTKKGELIKGMVLGHVRRMAHAIQDGTTLIPFAMVTNYREILKDKNVQEYLRTCNYDLRCLFFIEQAILSCEGTLSQNVNKTNSNNKSLIHVTRVIRSFDAWMKGVVLCLIQKDKEAKEKEGQEEDEDDDDKKREKEEKQRAVQFIIDVMKHEGILWKEDWPWTYRLDDLDEGTDMITSLAEYNLNAFVMPITMQMIEDQRPKCMYETFNNKYVPETETKRIMGLMTKDRKDNVTYFYDGGQYVRIVSIDGSGSSGSSKSPSPSSSYPTNIMDSVDVVEESKIAAKNVVDFLTQQ